MCYGEKTPKIGQFFDFSDHFERKPRFLELSMVFFESIMKFSHVSDNSSDLFHFSVIVWRPL